MNQPTSALLNLDLESRPLNQRLALSESSGALEFHSRPSTQEPFSFSPNTLRASGFTDSYRDGHVGLNDGLVSSSSLTISENAFEARSRLTDEFGSSVRNGLATELVVIDRGVENWQALLADLRQQQGGRSMEVLLLDRERDGLQQITESLSGYRDLSALHVISHGKAGGLQLGNGLLTHRNLDGYAADLVSWRDAFSSRADILLYGCNLAASYEGQTLVDSLAALTGADVAASTDLTGASARGGNWELEFQRGVIDSRLAFSASLQEEWQYVLDVNIDQAWLNARGPGPYYLDQQGETYILQTDVTTDGTAFAIIAKDITFDLNGHTITYDNADPITVFNGSFEQGTGAIADGWDFTNAPNAVRHEGVWLHNEVYDGDHSLKFSVPSANQYVTSTSTVTLEANTTYSLSAMFEYGGQGDRDNPGVKGYVRLIGNGLPTRETFWAQTNWRGIQHREGIFTTGNSAETYSIQVGIEGAASASPTNFFIDNIKLQQSRTSGVWVGPAGWANISNLTRFGSGDNATITNGAIIQGQNGATQAHGITFLAGNNSTVSQINLTVNGDNASAIFGVDQGTRIVNVHDNVFTSNVRTITNRDAFNGAVIKDVQGAFTGNNITNGVHAGIIPRGTVPSTISGNTIQLKSKYTNGFAIIASAGSQVFANTISNGQGEFASRGIGASGSTDAGKITRIYDNHVEVQQFSNNQEYQGTPIGGAYGIQLENASNIELFGNTVVAFGNESQAYALRINSSGSNLSIRDNTFQAISNGAKAATLKLESVAENTISVENNVLITNDGIIGETASTTATFRGNEIRIIDPVDSPRVIESFWWPGSGLHSELSFVDSVYTNSESRQIFENAVSRSYGNAYGIDNRLAYTASWTTAVEVRDANNQLVENAQVTVRDKDNQLVFEGVTDASGQISGIASQFRTQGSTKTSFNGHTITVDYDGKQTVQSFTADKTQTINLIAGRSRDDYTLEYTNNQLVVTGTEADNSVTWSNANPLQFTIDGFVFDLLAGTDSIEFRGLGGNDSIHLTGSNGSDTLILQRGNLAYLLADTIDIFAKQFETVEVAAAGGVNDVAYLSDTAGDDVFTSTPTVSTLTGDGYLHRVTGFDRVVANSSTSQTEDVAYFSGSAGNDQLYAFSNFTSMTSGSVVNRANGFSRTVSTSSAGQDTAYLYDSAGDNLASGDLTSFQLSGAGFSNSVNGFHRTFLYGSPLTGNDMLDIVGTQANQVILNPQSAILRWGANSVTATGFTNHIIRGDASSNADVRLTGGSGADALVSLPTETVMSGSGYRHQVTDFKRVRAFAGAGGNDTATFEDSAGVDEFRANPGWAQMLGTGFQNEAFGFGQVTGRSLGNSLQDRAFLVGSAGADTLTTDPTFANLGGVGYSVRAEGFGTTQTRGQGGTNTAILQDSAGDDLLNGDIGNLRLAGAHYSHQVIGFTSISVTATTGNDRLSLSDTVGNDTIVLGQGLASVASGLSLLTATGFYNQQVRSERGGVDSVRFNTGSGSNLMIMQEAFSALNGTGFYNRADGFRNVLASAQESTGTNRVFLYGSELVDFMEFDANFGRCQRNTWSRRFEGFQVATVYAGGDDDVEIRSPGYILNMNS